MSERNYLGFNWKSDFKWDVLIKTFHVINGLSVKISFIFSDMKFKDSSHLTNIRRLRKWLFHITRVLTICFSFIVQLFSLSFKASCVFSELNYLVNILLPVLYPFSCVSQILSLSAFSFFITDLILCDTC